MTAPLLDIQNLRVDYPRLVALEHFELQLFPGDCCALIGPNGAGKTTAMKAICGLVPTTFGRVMLGGVRLDEDPAVFYGRIAYMADSEPAYGHMKVRDFVAHHAHASGLKGAACDEAVKRCIEYVQLSEKIDARCKELSKGMRQRLTLARTLVKNPDVLILDEPAAGLDPVARKEMRSLLLHLRTQGKAILISSHVLSELESFSNKVVVLERGRIKTAGDVATLSQAAAHRRVRLRWLPSGAEPTELIASLEGIIVDEVRPGEHTLLCRVVNDEKRGAELLAQLVQGGVAVREWSPLDESLEHILMQSDARRVG